MRRLFVCSVVALALVARTGAATSYTTTFPLTENPISEGGNWTNGLADGFDWSNVRTTSGLAFGTQSGAGGFNDSIGVLKGTWAPDQAATATVFTVNQTAGDVFEEAEILLRFAITPHTARGYEINFSMRSDASYTQIVRWNGPYADYTLLDARVIPVLHTGDRVAASIVGNTLTTYVNGVEIFHVSDGTPFADGNPGIGFYLQGATGVNSDYGFSCYAASDNGIVPSCAQPVQPQSGRMTGGGRVLMTSGALDIEFELRCQPSGEKNLEVNWNGGKFKLENLTSALCYQDPSIADPKPPKGKGEKNEATFNTYQGKGTGRLNNVSGASATWTLTDQGEPGKKDTVSIQIRDRNNVLVVNASGRLVDGNIETHK
jgi:hypothetical protein